MRICVLASGSKGNCVYVETESHHLLIDIGTSSLHIERELRDIGVDPHSIDGILITHTHVDHIAGLRVFTKKYKTMVYLKEQIYKELEMMIMGPFTFIENDFYLDSLHVTCIQTSHDAENSVGYILEENKSSLVYLTDTGYIHEKNIQKLKGKNIYIIESNHDIEMLMNGKYPYHIKQRILGDKGHLSNKDSAYYMSKMLTDHTKKIILAHLSHENNTEEKALETYHQVFEKYGLSLPSVIIAKQDEKTEVIEV